MNNNGFSEEELRLSYQCIQPKYKHLADNLERELSLIFSGKSLSIIIEKRVKECNSFIRKVVWKQYTEPFRQTEDLCGLRVICNNLTDCNLVRDIIINEFIIIKEEPKEDNLHADQFRYRSKHFIIKLKESWLQTPSFRGLDELKAEIQVRTFLMHAWANISRQLVYEHEEYVPKELKRPVFRLSAILEDADEKLDDLWRKKIKYMEKVKESKDEVSDDRKMISDIDQLLVYLGFYFPYKEPGPPEAFQSVLNYIKENEVTRYEFLKSFNSVKDKVEDILNELRQLIILTGRDFYQYEVCLIVLDLTVMRFFKSRKSKLNKNYAEAINEIRETYIKQQGDL